jgi:hypothetical protein
LCPDGDQQPTCHVIHSIIKTTISCSPSPIRIEANNPTVSHSFSIRTDSDAESAYSTL